MAFKRVPSTLEFNMGEEDVGIIRGQMKWFDTYRTGNGEGKPLCIYYTNYLLRFFYQHNDKKK